MLIIKSLLLTLSFLTLSILAAPIPLNARALSFNDDTLFRRSDEGQSINGKGKVKPVTSLACTWSITDPSFLHQVNH